MMKLNENDILNQLYQRENNKYNFLKDLKSKPLFLWGGSTGGIKALKCCLKNKILIENICDSDKNKHGKEIVLDRTYTILDIKQVIAKYGLQNFNILIAINNKYIMELNHYLILKGIPTENIFFKEILLSSVLQYPYDLTEQ